MEIGNNTSLYGYNVDYFSRANFQEQAVSNSKGVQQDTRGVENNESSSQTNNKQNQNQTGQDTTKLSNEQQVQLAKLKVVDAQVRAHEAAHQSGPAAVGGASFTYTKGPDGIMYAIGGEVPVQIETSSDPQETISNLQGVIATALAPADPSPQDISIASKARVLMMKAQQELTQEFNDKKTDSDTYVKNALDQYEQNSNSSDSKDEPLEITA
ncbi:putative metalloprotease CJM1_0395 family protein [Halarcobacter ebronensis]|uniref:SprA-related family protein n=1 Tax=Halarcobacter ebronensis TaxID=1462615 RepID=A0A4Q1ARI8_9BACT|nr:putative metalloprotease CJM1_0395 family protein [Halarcobacter ebronensis]QKF80636.1 hypothetical protein AEBR_0118 [Halarcobacter ebronensis]RXK08437.1 hypothetical protein CRV07_01135 [Halarcobacter ebronensis]